VNVGRLQFEIGFRNCRTDIENSREVEFTGKKAEHCYLERDAYGNEAISKNSCWSTICSTPGTAGSVAIDKRRVSISLEGYELPFGNGDLLSARDTNQQPIYMMIKSLLSHYLWSRTVSGTPLDHWSWIVLDCIDYLTAHKCSIFICSCKRNPGLLEAEFLPIYWTTRSAHDEVFGTYTIAVYGTSSCTRD
jgi:hypothetical protein